MVGTARFELATPCTPSKCATRLRYVPTESAAQDDDDSVGVDLQILHQAASGRPLRPEWDCGRASIVVRNRLEGVEMDAEKLEGRTSAVVDALKDLAAKRQRLHQQPAIGLFNGRDLPRCGDSN